MNPPNEALASLIREAGMSFAGLARRVNDLGAGQRLDLTYDYTAVYRWTKKGERPRGGVPSIITTAIGERLGRTVTLAEIGLPSDSRLPSGTDLRPVLRTQATGCWTTLRGVQTIGSLPEQRLNGLADDGFLVNTAAVAGHPASSTVSHPDHAAELGEHGREVTLTGPSGHMFAGSTVSALAYPAVSDGRIVVTVPDNLVNGGSPRTTISNAPRPAVTRPQT